MGANLENLSIFNRSYQILVLCTGGKSVKKRLFVMALKKVTNF